MINRFILGSIALVATRLHYRHEVRPWAIKSGKTRDEIYRAALLSHRREFDRAWPQDSEETA